MKVKDYSYETFPRYTSNIDGALELKGNKENLRCRMKDVEYQKGCMIRFLFPFNSKAPSMLTVYRGNVS